jgi:hypothetical protein
MSINKCFFDFHLLKEGWLSAPPYEEGSKIDDPPDEQIMTLRMVEFGSDDKPDIWYKAEILHVGTNTQKAREFISKYGLPKAILHNCPSQIEELEEKLRLIIERT